MGLSTQVNIEMQDIVRCKGGSGYDGGPGRPDSAQDGPEMIQGGGWSRFSRNLVIRERSKIP